MNPFKRGILPPQKFLKLFGDLDIPNLVYRGKVNNSFIQSVRSRQVKGMTFEGVVCKGTWRDQIIMFKIKSKDWINKVKEEYNHNNFIKNILLDKSEVDLDENKYRQRRFCPVCFRGGSLSPICKCGAEALQLDFDAQLPRKKASKTRWRKFFQTWYRGLDFDFYWNNRRI